MHNRDKRGIAVTGLTLAAFCNFTVLTELGLHACRYFAPPEATDALKGSTLRAARFALGPSFGTLSLGALVLTLIEMARQALQQ